MSVSKLIKPIEKRHSRGYLPHFDAAGFTQFITFRLADSLPATIFENLEFKLKTRQINEIEYHWQLEKALDLGNGPTFLKDARIAGLVGKALMKFDSERYQLHSWVVMPNHVHLLFTPIDSFTVSNIMHSIKGYTASEANKVLGRSGRFWSPDYFDRFIRNRAHFSRAKRYIEDNPVKAGLCKTSSEWPWGSSGWRG